MDKSVVATLITVVAGFVTVALTHSFNRKRDREADLGKSRFDHEAEWRKLKLQSYSEYFTALSEALIRASDVAARSRYLLAANKLTLVAPPKVLNAYYPYQDASTLYASTPSPTKEEKERINFLAGAFLRAIREDCHPPGSPEDGPDLKFRIFLLPHEMQGTLKTPPEA